MTALVDLRVLELLCSRLCHELINPVGAISNGVELLSELGGEPDPEAIGLVAQSAKSAGGRLQFYRVAYGLAGTAGPELTLAEALALAEGAVVTARIVLDGPREGPDGARRLGRPATKLLLNLLLLAAEALTRGGRVGLALRLEGSGAGLEVTAEGDDARLTDETLGLLGDVVDVEALSARNVHAYFTARLAKALGLRFAIEQKPGVVRFQMTTP
jgi:histidine phosphotransferase ChpT